jgi:gamma-glutamyltranspeptidase/glutathione hydrolase
VTSNNSWPPRALFAALAALSLLIAGCSPANTPDRQATTANAQSSAAVAIPDRYGAQIAEDVLRAGGNAVDAAVAVGFSMAVTFIDAGNIGGGGFMMIYMDGAPAFLDYRETAALAAHRDLYVDERGEVIENASLIGARAAGVPGTVAGLWEAHQRYGKLPWKDLVMPAVRLAEDGFLPAKALVDDVHSMKGWFGDATNFYAHFGSISTEEPLRQPELGKTLRRIAELGPDDFYRGETARLIVQQMERGGGLITAEDLERYRAVWREPLRTDEGLPGGLLRRRTAQFAAIHPSRRGDGEARLRRPRRVPRRPGLRGQPDRATHRRRLYRPARSRGEPG